MVAHAAGIGWKSITPEVAKQKRGGESGMMFRDELEEALAKFNPWMTPDAVRQVIEKLEAIPPTIEETATCWPGCAANGNGTTRPRNVTGASRSSTSRRLPRTSFT